VEHIVYSTNEGNIRPAITVFPARNSPIALSHGSKDAIRIWNKSLILYAGYENTNGEVTGDQGNVDFTKVRRLL